MFGRDRSAENPISVGEPVNKGNEKNRDDNDGSEGLGVQDEEMEIMDEKEKLVSKADKRPFLERLVGNLPLLLGRTFLAVIAVIVYVIVVNNFLPLLWNERFQPMAAKSATFGFLSLFWAVVGPFVAAKIVAKQYDSVETYLALLLGNVLDAIIPGKQENLGRTIDRLHDVSVGHLMHLLLWGVFSIFPGSVLVLMGMVSLYDAFTYIR